MRLLISTRYYNERSNPEEAIPLLDLAQTLGESSGEDATQLLSHLHGCRASIASETNDPEGSLYHALSRVPCETKMFEISKIPTLTLAAAYQDVGIAYSLNGLYSKAPAMLYRSKEIRESIPGFQRIWLHSPLYHLGLTFWLQSNLEAASKYLEQAVSDREATFGKDDSVNIR
jgi:tetratricopeptide (TPR) repeat protein